MACWSCYDYMDNSTYLSSLSIGHPFWSLYGQRVNPLAGKRICSGGLVRMSTITSRPVSWRILILRNDRRVARSLSVLILKVLVGKGWLNQDPTILTKIHSLRSLALVRSKAIGCSL